MSIPKRCLPLLLAMAAMSSVAVQLPATASAKASGHSELAPGFTFKAVECPEPVAVFSIDAAVADDYVPAPFTVLLNPVGKATLAVAAANCQEIFINKASKGQALLSDVGIVIHNPEDPEAGGQHIYQLWQLTDNAGLRKAMARVGMFGALVSEATFEQSLLQASADFSDWAHSPYEMEATVAGAIALPPGANTWWHLGPHGVIKISYEFPAAEGSPGTTTVTAAPESPLAELLGAEERRAENLGMTVHHEYTGRIELVDLA